jgi:hypothetical protein
MRCSQKVYKTIFKGRIVDRAKKYASVEVCKFNFEKGEEIRKGKG